MYSSDPLPESTPSLPKMVAAVDLGSNSFHMIVARISDGDLQVIDRLKEMVRLGEGLTTNKYLSPNVSERALACLERFGQRVRDMPPGSVRAVGTNTLRQVRPETRFLERAEMALGHPIDIIAGREEARLIYLGVSHGLAADDGNRLVVDIGGGSTEVIIGQSFSPLLRESLHMGCVSMSRNHFEDGRITKRAMEEAELAGALEVRPIREPFRRTGWSNAVGSSGSIKSIRDVINAEGWCADGISAKSLQILRDKLIGFRKVSAIDLKGLSEERKPVFAGGVAVLRAVFRNLNIEHMQVSDKALREGLLYEMVGRIQHEDVRERTVAALCKRFGLDEAHGVRVESTASMLLEQILGPWQLGNPDHRRILGWAARLHEIGLTVAHSQYQKHGAYLLQNADLSGFTRDEQSALSALVLGHRRKFPLQAFFALPRPVQESARRLCVILRLAVLLHRGRSLINKPDPQIQVHGNTLRIAFPDGWLDDHPLTRIELEQEAHRLAAGRIFLEVR